MAGEVELDSDEGGGRGWPSRHRAARLGGIRVISMAAAIRCFMGCSFESMEGYVENLADVVKVGQAFLCEG